MASVPTSASIFQYYTPSSLCRDTSMDEMLARPVLLTNHLLHALNNAGLFRQQCADLKQHTERLASLLLSLSRAPSDSPAALYRRPLERVSKDLSNSLTHALALVRKCRKISVLKKVVALITAADFKAVRLNLDRGMENISWLLTVVAHGYDKSNYFGLPPVASAHPVLIFVWENIALLDCGSATQKEQAAMALASLMSDNEKNGSLIVEEGGMRPMLRALEEGTPSAREAVARALGCMAQDLDKVRLMLLEGAAPIFVKALRFSSMKVQASVAWTVANVLFTDTDSQEDFFQHGIITPLVLILSFETFDDSANNCYKVLHLHSVVVSCVNAFKAGAQNARKHTKAQNLPKTEEKPSSEDAENLSPEDPSKEEDVRPHIVKMKAESPDFQPGSPEGGGSWKEREREDPELKMKVKTEAARALWQLAKGNSKICKSITETNALLSFAKLVEKGKGDLVRYCLMAVVEISIAAEQDAELRRTAFKRSSPAAKAVVEQLLRLLSEGDSDIQLHCIKAIGCLARTFQAKETEVVKHLVSKLYGPQDITAEAVTALTKFVCTHNYLHREHAKAIVEASGATYLSTIINSAGGPLQLSAVILMCYLALYVDESEALAKAKALATLERVTKFPNLLRDPTVQKLLPQALRRLAVYLRNHSGSCHYNELGQVEYSWMNPANNAQRYWVTI